MKIELTRELAECIVEAENVCFGESQRPCDDDVWNELLDLIINEYNIIPYRKIP